MTRDFDLAEDCLQDAVERALRRWPAEGIPDNPEGWLVVAARNRAIDVLRRRRTEHDKLPQVFEMTEPPHQFQDEPRSPYDDDRLKLLFACCHPALPLAGRVALTLKTVTGLSTREVARAFLVTEATMSQRLLRVKTKIRNAGIALRVPPADRIADRVAGVLVVVYLLFNEGYLATEGEALRDGLTREAIQLGALLVDLLPGEAEARSLLALMLLQDSRRAARLGPDGALVPPDEQDRALWDRDQIAAGLRVLESASGGPLGPYRLQAMIAALHATASRPEETDWGSIVRLYDALLAVQPGPVVTLNRLVAVSYRDEAEAALAELPELERSLADYPLITAVRADLLRRAGRPTEAAAAYRVAISRAQTEAERRFLVRRLADVGSGGSGTS